MFRRAPANLGAEYEQRARLRGESLSLGVEFLDDALRGICPDDLVLIGAPSGIGKTQLCCLIAEVNISRGKRVHYVALEASAFEIERRLKFQILAEVFFADPGRPDLGQRLTYADWAMGRFLDELARYERVVNARFEAKFENLFLFDKGDKFGVAEMTEAIIFCAQETDLIIIDHVHYFDFDDDNENRAMKGIAKTVRALALEEQRPIVLVAHLRKRDKMNDELCPGLDEFHGSSDLTKIATKVITFSPGKQTSDGTFETFFRVPKNRNDGGVSRYLAREFFNPKRGAYEAGKYQLGWAEQKRSKGFESLDNSLIPSWAKRLRAGGAGDSAAPGGAKPSKLAPWSRPYAGGNDAD